MNKAVGRIPGEFGSRVLFIAWGIVAVGVLGAAFGQVYWHHQNRLKKDAELERLRVGEPKSQLDFLPF